jgi:NAD(P)-dependent dehydrogenase (short-subunit alcohol dehydrogenase family)
MTTILKSDRLANKRAIVTGGLSGIGRAITTAMAQEGAVVTIVDWAEKSRDDGLTAKAVVKTTGAKNYEKLDVSDPKGVDVFFKNVGEIDILVNNAGVTTFKPLPELTANDCDRLFAVNVRGVFLMTRAASMAWQRESRQGSIVNIASNLAFVGAPEASLYCATKGAVVSFTKAVAAELGPNGIRVNAVCPGAVETEFNRDYRSQGAQEVWESGTLLNNPGFSILATGERISPAIVFLASDEAKHITGASLLVDGGANAV